ncbi:MAG: sugar ABC transporter permease [Candidatus Bipolaricaulota bacterium]|nr:sugar ABC transporter permease [Candidatus Bipolaricaulota bacterium]
MRRRLSDRYDTKGFLFLAPALILLLLSIAFPLFRVIQRSLQEYSTQAGGFKYVWFNQYQQLFSDPLFWISVRNTFVFTLGSIALHLGLAYPIALLLNAKWPNVKVRNFFRGAFILPFLFSPPAAALLWGILFRPLGPLNYGLSKLGIGSIAFLGDPSWALFSVMLVNSWVYFPLYMILILGGLQSIPRILYDAARVDGANWFQRFIFVTLPQMRTLVITVILIDFATSFIHFDLVWTMTKGGPMRSTYLISFFLYEKGLRDFRLGYGSAVGVVIALIMAICITAYVLIAIRREEVTA